MAKYKVISPTIMSSGAVDQLRRRFPSFTEDLTTKRKAATATSVSSSDLSKRRVAVVVR